MSVFHMPKIALATRLAVFGVFAVFAVSRQSAEAKAVTTSSCVWRGPKKKAGRPGEVRHG